jgi:hypothetical protein
VKVLPVSNNALNDQSNTSVPLHLYVIVAVWLIFTVCAAIYFISNRLSEFDPEQKLVDISQETLVHRIMAELELPEHMPNTLINFISKSCSCNQTSKAHRIDVNKKASQEKMSVINVTLPENFSGIIPSTPAVLALNNKSELIYFGPYSEGLSCGSGEGIIDLVMSNYKKGYNAQLIIEKSTGCYCNV